MPEVNHSAHTLDPPRQLLSFISFLHYLHSLSFYSVFIHHNGNTPTISILKCRPSPTLFLWAPYLFLPLSLKLWKKSVYAYCSFVFSPFSFQLWFFLLLPSTFMKLLSSKAGICNDTCLGICNDTTLFFTLDYMCKVMIVCHTSRFPLGYCPRSELLQARGCLLSQLLGIVNCGLKIEKDRLYG